MTETEIVATIAGLATVGASLLLTAPGRGEIRVPWPVPAALSALFLLISIRAVAAGGPTGFWGEHTRNLWGIQIWCDLLLAAVASLALAIPRARAAGMRPLPWVLLTLITGSIGLHAMLARLFYLEGRSRPQRPDPDRLAREGQA